MPPTMSEQIEQKAKELLSVIRDYPYMGLMCSQKKDLEKLAKHVIASEIRARMNETDRYLDVIGSNHVYYTKRILELQDQLSDLDNPRKDEE